ncbi:MAG: hypothetical protein IH942_02845 [Acidobacteria bacterium]|nr:hypothetical protein [Acidobacteriota bacterium]
MNEMDEERRDELIEEHVRYLRGQGPAPDLSELSEAEAVELRRSFATVDALAGALPLSPPIEEDPVAIRLGLVGPSTELAESTEPADGDHRVADAVSGLSYQFPQSVEVHAVDLALADAADSVVPAFVCQSLAERVMVIVYPRGSEPRPGIQEALDWLDGDPDLTAVAFTSSDAEEAKVVTYPDCHRQLSPDTGWRDVSDALDWEPLTISLGRHFEQSIMQWDEVMGLDQAGSLDDITSDIPDVIKEERALLASSKPRLPHKRRARDFISTVPDELLEQWMAGVRSEEVTGEELADEIRQRVQAAS